ncbi:MAG: hypothetical protein B6I20_00555 [Bacteroidetes bacterium 4572_117]|nr:MAG: hypothetical protein B6I20_00555 [Bacteroidetes bacterium 4572_117]
MIIEYITKGIIVGIAVTAPVGPLGVLCIQRTINRGVFSGLVTGFASALADIMYAIIAGFGVSVIADFLDANQVMIRIIGGIIVVVLGIRIYLSNPAKQYRRQKTQKRTYISDLISGFLITITNPVVIVVFGAVFASLGLDKVESGKSVIITIVGVFAGAIGWWLFLTTFVNIFRAKINFRKLWWINKITGSFVTIFGLGIIISTLFIAI